MAEVQHEFEYTETMANKVQMAQQEIDATLKKYGVHVNVVTINGLWQVEVLGRDRDDGREYHYKIQNTPF